MLHMEKFTGCRSGEYGCNSLERESSKERELSKNLASRGLCATVRRPFGMSTAWNRNDCVPTASVHGFFFFWRYTYWFTFTSWSIWTIVERFSTVTVARRVQMLVLFLWLLFVALFQIIVGPFNQSRSFCLFTYYWNEKIRSPMKMMLGKSPLACSASNVRAISSLIFSCSGVRSSTLRTL